MMTVADAKQHGLRLLGWTRAQPLALRLGVLGLALAAAAVLALGFSGPSYEPLFQGLTPSQGGAVITQLQKLGVPYRLENGGTVIAVPADQLGQARLNLAQAGLPETGGSGAWKQLEHASMTASTAAVGAIRLRAMETSLSHTLQAVTGARHVRVLLALPQHTPFLADQPRPKASVVLEGVPQADGGTGLTAAQVVAGAVPGLAAKDVVVATARGRVLYPVSTSQSVSDQLALRQQVEAGIQSKIRSLLDPVFGPRRYRVAVSANVDFTHKQVHAVDYGPTVFPVSVDKQSDKQVGKRDVIAGIPGALSNEPPGPTAGLLNQPGGKAQGQGGQGGNGQAGGNGQGGNGSAGGKAQHALPHSDKTSTKEQYAIDTKDTVETLPSWRIAGVAVSVVVDRAAMGSLSSSAIRTMITDGIDVANPRIAVTSAPFVSPQATPSATGGRQALIRHGLFALAAVFLLLGVGFPLVRWLAARGTSVAKPAVPSMPGVPDPQQALLPRQQLETAVNKIKSVAREEPALVARTLQKWVEQG